MARKNPRNTGKPFRPPMHRNPRRKWDTAIIQLEKRFNSGNISESDGINWKTHWKPRMSSNEKEAVLDRLRRLSKDESVPPGKKIIYERMAEFISRM